MQNLVSVIIPVYNVEEYLNRCIESVVNQTYSKLDIILIDDGSTDQSSKTCDKWEKKDERIRVIHKKNGGLSDARNVGVKGALGEYIIFVDSDDWIHEKYIEYLYGAIEEHKVLLAACDVQWVYDVKKRYISNEPEIIIYNAEQALETLLEGKKFRAVVWNKIYHKSLLQGEKFEVGRYHEDEFFSYRILGKCNKVAYVKEKLYYYFQRENSIMSTFSEKHLDVLDAYIERISYISKNYPSLLIKDKLNLCKVCINFYQNRKKISVERQKQYKKKIKECRKSIEFEIFEWKDCTLKELIYIIGSRYFIAILSDVLLLRRRR